MRIRISPSQKVGVDCPRVANHRVPTSIQLPRRTAEMMPIGRAITTARNMEAKASSSVAGRRLKTRSRAGSR
jgi:hypothetical protein